MDLVSTYFFLFCLSCRASSYMSRVEAYFPSLNSPLVTRDIIYVVIVRPHLPGHLLDKEGLLHSLFTPSCFLVRPRSIVDLFSNAIQHNQPSTLLANISPVFNCAQTINVNDENTPSHLLMRLILGRFDVVGSSNFFL